MEATASAPITESAAAPRSRANLWLVAVSMASLVLSGSLWLKLSNIQEALARQSADASSSAIEARTLAKAAQDAVRESTTRQVLLETRISEIALQRSQLEELMQNLSRSRDENLVVDIESSLRLAQQQASLTGSVEPLIAALRTAEQRIARSAQPRLNPVQRAIAKDLDRIKTSSVADTPGLLIKLDELVRLADEMPVVNAVAATSRNKAQTATVIVRDTPPNQGTGILTGMPTWLQNALGVVRDEARALVRVGRIDTPEAALLAPEQSFFARENLKLRLLNARLSLLSRQIDAVRADLSAADKLVLKYFDTQSRSTRQMLDLMQQLAVQIKSAEIPRIDDTLASLATAAASALPTQAAPQAAPAAQVPSSAPRR
jgi:uroporphyrin-III C-methyltransferase